MSYTSLPTVTPGEATRASWGNLVDSNLDDHESRIGDLETIAGSGSVTGPVSSTDNAIPRFDGTGGGTLQNSGITIADVAIGTLAGSNSGDVTLSGSPSYLTIVGQVITKTLIDLTAHVINRLPFANLTAATAANRLLGRGSTAGAGDFQEIALGAGLSLVGTVLSATGAGGSSALDDLTDVVITTPATDDVLQYDGAEWINQPAANLNAGNLTAGTIPAARLPALTGDVTTSAGTVATTIANDAVTNAKAANMAQSTIKGRAVSAGTGDPTDLTATQATAILDAMVGDSGAGGTKGLAPAPASGDAAAGKFLKADGTWVAPSGTGAPASAQYVTLATDGTLTSERVLTGSANQVTVTDGGAGNPVTLSTPQDHHTGAVIQYARLGLAVAADADAKLKIAGQYGSTTVADGSSGTSKTIDWNDGNTRFLTLTGACTLTLSNPKDGFRYLIVLLQDGSGGKTVTWPSSVKWQAGTPPTLSVAANKADLVTLVWIAGLGASGNYLAACNTDYTPA
jgi:hypothetical protein